MPTLIKKPTVIAAFGNKPKEIREYIGRVNSKTDDVSIARMKSPGGWVEPGQQPEFDEYTLVLRGMLRVTTKDGVMDVREAGNFPRPESSFFISSNNKRHPHAEGRFELPFRVF